MSKRYLFRALSASCSCVYTSTSRHGGRVARTGCSVIVLLRVLYAPALGGILEQRDPSVCLSVPWRSCLGYGHAGCLQLSHRRPPEMCGLQTRPQTDVDPPRFLDRTVIGISSRRLRGDTLSGKYIEIC